MIARAACAVALAALVPSAGSARQTFRSGVDLVRVDALITDGRKPIAGLAAKDFELRDNGVLQSIDSAVFETLPLSIVCVLDTSGSVAGRKLSHLGDAVDLMLEGLRPDDRVALVTFSHRVWLKTPLISDFGALRRMMSAAEAAGGTALRDAVYAGLAISDVQESRPLLIAFSDGLDNMSWMGAGVVERAARRSNAVVYGVAVAERGLVPRSRGSGRPIELAPQYAPGQTDFLEAVADATGGRLLKADTTDKLPKAFDDILREFRTRYLITYSPQHVDAPGWHRIDLKVKKHGADVKARAGYQK